MQKSRIRRYVEQDKLREALDELAKGLPEEASLLKGRLTNKDTQWHNGALSREDYSIERNQLRQAILRLLDGATATHSTNPFKWIVIGVVFVGALVLGAYQFYFAEPSSESIIENAAENGNTNERPEETRTIMDLSEPLKTWIDQQATIEDEVTGYPLSVTKDYKVGLAYLKRKFGWPTFPFPLIRPPS